MNEYDLNEDVLSDFYNNKKKLGRTQISINRRMDRKTGVLLQ